MPHLNASFLKWYVSVWTFFIRMFNNNVTASDTVGKGFCSTVQASIRNGTIHRHFPTVPRTFGVFLLDRFQVVDVREAWRGKRPF